MLIINSVTPPPPTIQYGAKRSHPLPDTLLKNLSENAVQYSSIQRLELGSVVCTNCLLNKEFSEATSVTDIGSFDQLTENKQQTPNHTERRMYLSYTNR